MFLKVLSHKSVELAEEDYLGNPNLFLRFIPTISLEKVRIS